MENGELYWINIFKRWWSKNYGNLPLAINVNQNIRTKWFTMSRKCYSTILSVFGVVFRLRHWIYQHLNFFTHYFIDKSVPEMCSTIRFYICVLLYKCVNLAAFSRMTIQNLISAISVIRNNKFLVSRTHPWNLNVIQRYPISRTPPTARK